MQGNADAPLPRANPQSERPLPGSPASLKGTASPQLHPGAQAEPGHPGFAALPLTSGDMASAPRSHAQHGNEGRLNSVHIRSLLVDDAPSPWPAQSVAVGSSAPNSAVSPAAQRPLVPPPPMPPFTIEVTIGRIDVRVTPPPPPAKSPRRGGQKPALSLQDYLDRRNRP